MALKKRQEAELKLLRFSLKVIKMGKIWIIRVRKREQIELVLKRL